MSTTFVNEIDSMPLYADRAEKDAAGNTISTTYAAKSEIVNADWDATSGDPGFIENKPTIPDGVPAVTSSDDAKVLTASYSGGVGSYSWETASGGGNVFMATSTTTFPELWQAFHEEGKIVYCTNGSASSLQTPYFLQTLKAYDSGHTTGTATFVQFNRYSTGRIETYHSTVTFNSSHPTLGTVTFSSQTIVPDNPQNHAGEFLAANSGGNMTFASVNQVPASTSADADKVLTVDSQGTPAWSTPSAGGVTDVEVNGSSVVSGGVASITVPAAQVQTDWDATSGMGAILNRPAETSVEAGTGIKITEPTSSTLRISTDETVLYTGTDTVADNLEVNLSEAFTNFERIRIYGESWNNWCPKLWGEIICSTRGQAYQTSLTTSFLGASGAAIRFVQMFVILTSTKITFSHVAIFSIQGTAVSSGTPTNTVITKVVGVNRVASN